MLPPGIAERIMRPLLFASQLLNCDSDLMIPHFAASLGTYQGVSSEGASHKPKRRPRAQTLPTSG